MLPALVDIAIVAEALGVTPRHVRRLVAERRLPYVKVGNLIRFDPVELLRWLDEQRVMPVQWRSGKSRPSRSRELLRSTDDRS